MNSKGRRLKREIISDLTTIVNDLNSSANTIRGQKGVGCEYCADKLEDIARRYRQCISNIRSVD